MAIVLHDGSSIRVGVQFAPDAFDLVVADASHSHSAPSGALLMGTPLQAPPATHGHSAPAGQLVQQHFLLPAAARHTGHSAPSGVLAHDGPTLTVVPASHDGHSAPIGEITTSTLLEVRSSTHEHIALRNWLPGTIVPARRLMVANSENRVVVVPPYDRVLIAADPADTLVVAG